MQHIRFGRLFCSAMMVTTMALSPLALASDSDMSVLRVTGESQLSVPADLAAFSIGVQNSAPEALAALEKNSQMMQQLKRALVEAGVSDDELSSGAFSVQPQWQSRPRNTENGWKPSIIGYQAQAQLLVETGRLDKVADYIQAGVDAGANQIGQLRFSLQDDERVHQQALTQATAQARQRAEVVANAAGVELGALSRIDVDPQQIRPYPSNRVNSMARMASEGVVPVVVPANIDVHATIELTYRLQ